MNPAWLKSLPAKMPTAEELRERQIPLWADQFAEEIYRALEGHWAAFFNRTYDTLMATRSTASSRC